MLLMNGTPGEIYNICSGKEIALSDIIDQIADIVGIRVDTKVNPEFIRPNDNRIVVGSREKLTKELGWEPEIPWEQTLRDMVAEMSK